MGRQLHSWLLPHMSVASHSAQTGWNVIFHRLAARKFIAWKTLRFRKKIVPRFLPLPLSHREPGPAVVQHRGLS